MTLMILFSVLRRAAGNYGRLALVRRKDEALNTVRWTELFFAPDDVSAGRSADQLEDGAGGVYGAGMRITSRGQLHIGECCFVKRP